MKPVIKQIFQKIFSERDKNEEHLSDGASCEIGNKDCCTKPENKVSQKSTGKTFIRQKN